jgi:hypothetical protein
MERGAIFVRNEDRVPDMDKLASMFGIEWVPLGDEISKKKFILKEARAKKKCLTTKGCIGILETQWPRGNPSKGPNKYYALWRVKPHDKAATVRAYLSDVDTYIDGTRREIPPDGRKTAFFYVHDNGPRTTSPSPAPTPFSFTASSESFTNAPGPASSNDTKDSCVNALNAWKANDEQREKQFNENKLAMQTLRDFLIKSPHLDSGVQFKKPWLVPWETSTKTKYGSYRWRYQWREGTAYDSNGGGYSMTKWDKNGGLNSGGEHLAYKVIMMGTHCNGSGRDHQPAELSDPINLKAACDVLNLKSLLYEKEKYDTLKKYIDFANSFTLPDGSVQKVMFKPFAESDVTLFYRRMAERDCGTDEPVDVIQISKTEQRINLEKTWMKDIDDEIAKQFVPTALTMGCNDCRQVMSNAQSGGQNRNNVYQQTLNCINNLPSTTTTTTNNPTVNQDPRGAGSSDVDDNDEDDDDFEIAGQKINKTTAWYAGGGAVLFSISSCCCCFVLILIFFMMRN